MSPQFCPHCRTPLILAAVQGRDREQCPTCGYTAYHNPAPVALALIEHAGELVLIKRNLEPLRGYWAPPGGYVEVGESVEEAVVREAREETGLEIAVDALVGVYSQADVKVVILAYRAHSLGGEPVAGDDAGDILLVAPGQVPVQPPPQHGTALDHWFHRVIREVTAPWQWGHRPIPRSMRR